MSETVVVTRDGWGDAWKFPTFRSAVDNPIYQYGDLVLSKSDSPDRIVKQIGLPAIPLLMQKLRERRLEETTRLVLSATSAMRFDERVTIMSRHASEILAALLRAAREPPTDPGEIVRIVVSDRRLADRGRPTMNDTPDLNPDATPEAPEPKKGRKKKEAAEGAPASDKPKAPPRPSRFADSDVVRMGADKEGKPYGPENNPKRPGSESHDRFAKYRDGKTVRENIDAGVRSADIAWDVDHGFIVVEKSAAPASVE